MHLKNFCGKSIHDFYSAHENDFYKYFSLENTSLKLQCYYIQVLFVFAAGMLQSA